VSVSLININSKIKKFRTGLKQKTVVDQVSVNFYENQITGLLGRLLTEKNFIIIIIIIISLKDTMELVRLR
jgi:ABC-type antimicrobial peptide transport system ATPase subunit